MAFLGVYGHVNVDHLFHLAEPLQPNATVEVAGRERFWGGTGANIAAAAAAMGVPTALAAFVGEDFPPEFRAWLEAQGVDLTDLVVKPGFPTPRWWGFEDPGHNVVGIIEQGPMRAMEEFEPLDYTMLGAQWVHFATGRPRAYLPLMRQAREAGKGVGFDPGQELRFLWEPEAFEQALNASRVFFCNEHELRQALDKLRYGDVAQLFDHTEMVVVTRGREGAALHTERETVRVAPYPVKTIVDTTGAGDALRAGFYAALHRGLAWPDCLRHGVAAASFALEARGAQANLPTWERVAERAGSLAAR